MHTNLYNNEEYSTDLQLQTVDTKTHISNPSASPAESQNDWVSAFNTSLLTTRAHHAKDRSMELSDLMQTPEFASLLIGAQHLATSQGLSKEEATERLIEVFRRIDFAWKQIVIKRGLQAIIE
jgi:hypothetical protein